MVTVWVGVLIFGIGALGFPKRKRWLAECRASDHETSGPTLNVLIAYGFPVIGLLTIALGLISAL